MSAEAGWHRPVPRNPRIAPPPPASQARSPAGRRNLIASRAILKAERRAPKRPAAPAFKTARDVPTMGCQPCLARWTRLAAAPVRDDRCITPPGPSLPSEFARPQWAAGLLPTLLPVAGSGPGLSIPQGPFPPSRPPCCGQPGAPGGVILEMNPHPAVFVSPASLIGTCRSKP